MAENTPEIQKDYTRPKFYNVKSSLLRLDPENERIDKGDLDWLANNIEEEGVKQALSGYIKTIDGQEYFFVVDGSRRFEALQILLKKGVEIYVPFRPSTSEKSKEQNIVDRYIYNTGKSYTTLEKAHSVGKLIKYNWTIEKIAQALTFSAQWVSDLYMLYCSPQGLKDLILSGRLKGTLAIELLKQKDFDVYVFLDDVVKGKYDPQPKPEQQPLENFMLAMPTEENTIGSENESTSEATDPPKAKITRKTLSNGINSFKSFKKYAKASSTFVECIPAHRRETWDFMMRIINDDISETEIADFFIQQPTDDTE